MKHNLEYTKLGHICSFERGVTYSKKDESEVETDNIILRSNNIDLETYSLNRFDLKYLKAEFNIKNEKRLRANSILICMSNGSLAHLGKTAFISSDSNMAFGGFMGLIIPKRENPKYISYFFRSKLYYEFLESLNRGANIRNIQFSRLSELKMPVPSERMQEQIVAELDKINEIISDCKEVIRNLDSLAQSLFYDYFGDPTTNPKGWKIKALRDIIIGKLAYGAGASGVPFDGNVRYIRITDIGDNGKLKPEIAASPSVYESKYELQDGDILFARSGATVGKTYLYRSEIGKAIYAGYLIKATVNRNKILPQYLFTLGKTSYYWNYIRQSINGVAQPNVNAQSYGDFLVPIPPLSLQEKFVAHIEQIEQQKKDLENTIAYMQTLLDSRMDYWFG